MGRPCDATVMGSRFTVFFYSSDSEGTKRRQKELVGMSLSNNKVTYCEIKA